MADAITEKTATDCLLVIDDQPDNIQTLRSLLEPLGFEILPAKDGAQAIQVLSIRRPDLILLDLLIPGMEGFEICHRIQENPDWAEIPIIFLSSVDDKPLVVRALENGGVDFIAKPFNHPELIARVRTQLMLKTARDHARRLAQDKDEMLSMISHYLQNHLAGMQMSAESLWKRTQMSDDPKLRLMIENIRSASSQMRSFVKAFLANAVADRGLVIKLEPISLTDAAARIARQYEDAARSKKMTIHTEFSRKSAMILADANALDQVLENLLSNAVKFSPLGKEIFIRVERSLGQMECHIQDQGPGFTDQDKARLFGRYARLSAQPTGGEPSTGLGLSIAKKLVGAMNGDLKCESVAGQGATFILRMPLAPLNF